MFTFPFTFYGDGNGFLDSVVSNMELELDASESDSYPGSGQTWSNLTENPDSGAAKTANDFFLGVDGSASGYDPTFNLDRFDLDGGDFFETVGNTSWMDTLGHSDQPVTFIVVFDKGVTVANVDYFFSSSLVSPGGSGILFRTASDGKVIILQDSGGSNLSETININITTSSTDNLLIISIDYSTSKIETWFNSKTPIVNSSLTFDTTDTGSSSVPVNIAAHNRGNFLPSGDSMKLFAIRNKASTDAEVESMIEHLNTRHGVTYA